jgi:hypothetical protein
MKFCFFLFIVSFSKIFLPGQDDSLIDWKPGLKLTWDDFRRPPDPSSPNAALTGTIIRYDFGYNSVDGLKFHIHCQFNKNNSWGRNKTDYILSHEQGHFDIAEIFARKLDKAFKEYTPTDNIKKDLNKIYSDIMHQYSERQLEYDKETNNSINKPEQEEWLRKISEELKDSQAYANYN